MKPARRRFPRHTPIRSPAKRSFIAALAGFATALCGLLLAPGLAAASATTGSIEGEVTSFSDHAGIAGIEVCAYGSESEETCSVTSASGGYTLSGLLPGKYIVEFWATESLNYLTQYYNGKSSIEAAEEVSVTAGSTHSGIDAEMHEGGEISGEVASSSSQAGIGEVVVCAYEATSKIGSCALSEANGKYTVAGLPSGKYTVEFLATISGLNYLTQYYNGKSSAAEAQAVPVTVGETTNEINAAMHEGGQIAGTVTDAASAAALSRIAVCALETSGSKTEAVACVLTSATGTYRLPGLRGGSYQVEFDPSFEEGGSSEYLSQFYNGRATLAQADPVSVSVPLTQVGIDARLVRTSTLWPAITDPPVLSGTTAVGGTLFCSTGSWNNSPSSYSYAWQRNGVGMAIGNTSTDTVQSADLGAAITCQVKAKNSYGTSTATSNIVEVPALISPPASPLPAVEKCRRGFKKIKRDGKARCQKTKRSRRHKPRRS